MQILFRLAYCSASVLAVSVVVARPAHAYIDPGTGSYFVQVAAAAVLGALFVVKTFWRNLRDGVTRLVVRRPR